MSRVFLTKWRTKIHNVRGCRDSESCALEVVDMLKVDLVKPDSLLPGTLAIYNRFGREVKLVEMCFSHATI
jgi:hypothetical protein